jgi:Flp pilus assembly pilin Flp
MMGGRKEGGEMREALRLVRSWVDDEDGANLVEYVMLAALIAVVCVAAVSLLGKAVRTKLDAPRAALSR